MGRETTTKYFCDMCKSKLKTCHNTMSIVTSKSESDHYWERLHVKIALVHGAHNDCETEDAELCQQCAIRLLTDALKRVSNGERATAGVESSRQEYWR